MCHFKAFHMPVDKKKKKALQIYRARRLKFQKPLFERSEIFKANSLQNPTHDAPDDN